MPTRRTQWSMCFSRLSTLPAQPRIRAHQAALGRRGGHQFVGGGSAHQVFFTPFHSTCGPWPTGVRAMEWQIHRRRGDSARLHLVRFLGTGRLSSAYVIDAGESAMR